MKYENLEAHLSRPRLQRFLKASGASKVKAQRHYRANLRVAQSFYPLLNLFEIILRNNITNQIASHFSDRNWILTQKNQFMSDNSLSRSRFFLKNSVEKEERLEIVVIG